MSQEFGFEVTMAPVFTHGVKVSEDRAGAFSLDHSRVGSPPILGFTLDVLLRAQSFLRGQGELVGNTPLL